jgi:hypothetical protein
MALTAGEVEYHSTSAGLPGHRAPSGSTTTLERL